MAKPSEMAKRRALCDTSSSSVSDSENDSTDSLAPFVGRHGRGASNNRQSSNTISHQSSASSLSSTGSSAPRIRKANAATATNHRHRSTKPKAKPTTRPQLKSTSKSTKVTTKRRLMDASLDSSSDDDDDFVFQKSSNIGKSVSKEPRMKESIISVARPTKKESSSHLDDDLSCDSDDTAELVKQLEKAKQKFYSINSPLKHLPPPMNQKTGNSRPRGGNYAAKRTEIKEKDPVSSNSIAPPNCNDDPAEDLADTDADDESSVDTVELSKRCPTKPGIQRPEFKVSSEDKPKTKTPSSEARLESPRLSSAVRRRLSPVAQLQQKNPQNQDPEPSRKGGPVCFQLPDRFDSSSSSESEDADAGHTHQQNDPAKRLTATDVGRAAEATRPTYGSESVANKPNDSQRNVPPIYNPHADSRGRQTAGCLNEQDAFTFGGRKSNDIPTDRTNHASQSQIARLEAQRDDELFHFAFAGERAAPDLHADCSAKTPVEDQQSVFTDTREQQNSSSSLQYRTDKDLFRCAIDGEKSLAKSRFAPDTLDDRTEEELFHSAFISGEQNIEPSGGETLPHRPQQWNESLTHHIRQGFSRREPFPWSSPAYNIAARSFLNPSRRERVDKNQDRLTTQGEIIDLIDDDPTEGSHPFRKSAPRRITEDHACHPEWPATRTIPDERTQFPGRLARPWDHNQATQRKRRIRDATAGNHAMAASVATKKTQARKDPVATRDPSTQTAGTSGFTKSGDIRRFLRSQPLVDSNAQQQRDLIRSQRHDIEGHSEIMIVNRPAAAKPPLRQKSVLDDDDIIEVFDDDPFDRAQFAAQRTSAKPTQQRRKREGSSSRSKGSSGRKRARGKCRGRGRGRGRGGKGGFSARGRGGSGRGRNSGSNDGVWGGDAAEWGTTTPFRREDPAFEGIGAEISF